MLIRSRTAAAACRTLDDKRCRSAVENPARMMEMHAGAFSFLYSYLEFLILFCEAHNTPCDGISEIDPIHTPYLSETCSVARWSGEAMPTLANMLVQSRGSRCR